MCLVCLLPNCALHLLAGNHQAYSRLHGCTHQKKGRMFAHTHANTRAHRTRARTQTRIADTRACVCALCMCMCPRIPRMHAFHDCTCACVCFILATKRSSSSRVVWASSRAVRILFGLRALWHPFTAKLVHTDVRLKGTQRNWSARCVDLALADGRPW